MKHETREYLQDCENIADTALAKQKENKWSNDELLEYVLNQWQSLKIIENIVGFQGNE